MQENNKTLILAKDHILNLSSDASCALPMPLVIWKVFFAFLFKYICNINVGDKIQIECF